jgi:hypothetical protein
MPYTVTWDVDAEDALANLWMQASDPQAVSVAVNTIERNLRLAPLSVGYEYNGDRWYRIDPVTVIYHVSPDDRLVKILQVTVQE